MFYRWFDQVNSRMECSLRQQMQQIDKRIINIKPPKYVPTAPRSIYTWKQWRAHEYLSFILFYSLPIFIDMMYETSHLEHLIKLVIFMEIILSREIKNMHIVAKICILSLKLRIDYKNFFGCRSIQVITVLRYY
jgi:K+-sensing histidine kinase KdpD